ncbi:MAG: cytochrome-c peroxidase [Candidatus Solibacter sp.]|nr:cytochrome-c peroxidase [Candidatus Solibacter sp.]
MRMIPLLLLLALALSGCGSDPASKNVEIDASRLRLFKPLPARVDVKPGGPEAERVALGRMLYYEPRLSKGHDIACNDCHLLDKYGVDNQPTSGGHKGRKGDRNSPTVYNAALHFTQFWDGRAADVEEQAKGPILNPVEMAMPDEKRVVAVMKSIPGYAAAFKAAFPDQKDPITYDNIANAIGTFERGLLTPSRWDKFLKGDAALTNEEKAGFNAFLEAGCQTCHMGVLIGGNLYQKLGLAKAYPELKDEGRAKVTKEEGDKFFFKVPSLRNIEKTGPYFHDGKVVTLVESVKQMGEYQLGAPLKDEQVKAIIAWLKSLTGEIPADYIRKPELPPSGPNTPKPDKS